MSSPERQKRDLDALSRHLAGILAEAHEAVVSVDESQSIVVFNRGAERAFGYERSEVLGRPLEMLVPMSRRERHRTYVQRYLESSDEERPMGIRGEIVGRKRNGRTFPCRASIYKSSTGNATIMTAVLLDLTSTRKSARRLESLFLERQRLARQLIECQEAERHHVARELHDELGQCLTAIGVNATLLRGADPGVAEADDPAATIARTADHASRVIRELIATLRPPTLDQLGLRGAIAESVERLALRATGVSARIEIDPRLEALPDAVVTTIYRIIQEALTNVARHAHAHRVRVRADLGDPVRRWLRRHVSLQAEMPHLRGPNAPDRMIHIRVADDGIGIDPRDARTGLRVIRERCDALGGRLYVRRAGARGTQVDVHIPVWQGEAAGPAERGKP
ncbi:MAG TPA: PAS domain S-box protein [Gammaproteobacteria bacterium]|nr:PAS domain S-box protein [Gammaproteobacteria bacterium]